MMHEDIGMEIGAVNCRDGASMLRITGQGLRAVMSIRRLYNGRITPFRITPRRKAPMQHGRVRDDAVMTDARGVVAGVSGAARGGQARSGDRGRPPRSPLACSILHPQSSILRCQFPGIPGSVMSRTLRYSLSSSSVSRFISRTTLRTLLRSLAAFFATSLALS